MIQLRVATPQDAAACAAIYAPYVTGTVITFETELPKAADFADRIGKVGAQYPWLIAADGDTVFGYAYAGPHNPRPAYRWSVDVAIYLASTAHRRGIGRRLYQALLALLLRQGYYNAYGRITVPNDASIGLHEALGFERVGYLRRAGYKLGGWYDVGFWELLMRESAAEPGEPIAFADLPPAEVREMLEAS